MSGHSIYKPVSLNEISLCLLWLLFVPLFTSQTFPQSVLGGFLLNKAYGRKQRAERFGDI